MSENSETPGFFEELATDVGGVLEDITTAVIPGEWDDRILDGEVVDHATDVGAAMDDLAAADSFGDAGGALGSMLDEYADQLMGAVNPLTYLLPDELEPDLDVFETVGETVGEAVDWAADAASDVVDWFTGDEE